MDRAPSVHPEKERVWQQDLANHAEARRDIADYIAGFYNHVRLHAKLGNRPPSA